MAALLREIRHGWRLIWRTPAQSVSAVTVLALGIGLTTALFSVVYAVQLKPLPYANPEQLVIVASTDPSGTVPTWMTGADVLGVQALAAESSLFQAVAPFDSYSSQAYAWLAGDGDGDGDGEAGAMERLRAGFVTPAFFPLLGIQPVPLEPSRRRRSCRPRPPPSKTRTTPSTTPGTRPAVDQSPRD